MNVGYVLLELVTVRPIFHEKWDGKVPRRWGIFNHGLHGFTRMEAVGFVPVVFNLAV